MNDDKVLITLDKEELKMLQGSVVCYIDEQTHPSPEHEKLLKKIKIALEYRVDNLDIDDKFIFFEKGKLAGNDILDMFSEAIKINRTDILTKYDGTLKHIILKGYMDADGNILKKIIDNKIDKAESVKMMMTCPICFKEILVDVSDFVK